MAKKQKRRPQKQRTFLIEAIGIFIGCAIAIAVFVPIMFPRAPAPNEIPQAPNEETSAPIITTTPPPIKPDPAVNAPTEPENQPEFTPAELAEFERKAEAIAQRLANAGSFKTPRELKAEALEALKAKARAEREQQN